MQARYTAGVFNFITESRGCSCGNGLSDHVHWLCHCEKYKHLRPKTKSIMRDAVCTPWKFKDLIDTIYDTEIRPLSSRNTTNSTTTHPTDCDNIT